MTAGNVRLHLGAHALVFLAVWDRPVPSTVLSYSAGTNPVVLRELLGDLRAAGLVTSRRGPGGGFSLARPADEITLLDVYRAVDAGPIFKSYEDYPVAACPVGGRISGVMDAALEPAVDAFTRRLNAVTIGDLTEEIRQDAESEFDRPLVEELLEQRAAIERGESGP